MLLSECPTSKDRPVGLRAARREKGMAAEYVLGLHSCRETDPADTGRSVGRENRDRRRIVGHRQIADKRALLPAIAAEQFFRLINGDDDRRRFAARGIAKRLAEPPSLQGWRAA